MVMQPPLKKSLKDKKLTLKDDFTTKRNKVVTTIKIAMEQFKNETGVKILKIVVDNTDPFARTPNIIINTNVEER